MIQHNVCSGHAANDLREQFLDAIEARLYGSTVEADTVTHRLTGRLWNCTDILPGEYCDALEIPRGSTYAQAARYLREALV